MDARTYLASASNMKPSDEQVIMTMVYQITNDMYSTISILILNVQTSDVMVFCLLCTKCDMYIAVSGFSYVELFVISILLMWWS